MDQDLHFAASGIALTLVTLGAATYFFLQGIEAKWRSSEFGE